MILQLKPFNVWHKGNSIEANTINFLPATYSFENSVLQVNYQILSTKVVAKTRIEIELHPDPETGESSEVEVPIPYNDIETVVLFNDMKEVPNSVTSNWVSDEIIFDYILKELNLQHYEN